MAVTLTSIRLDTDFADEAVKVLKAKSARTPCTSLCAKSSL